MRKVNEVNAEATIRCPKEGCGYEFHKKITVKFTTNQRGDVIEQHAIVK